MKDLEISYQVEPGRAYARQDAVGMGIRDSLLRAEGVVRPHWGVWGLRLASTGVRNRCLQYVPRMQSGDAFSHATALELYGVPLPRRMRDGELHVSSARGSRPRVRGVVGHREKYIQIHEVEELPLVYPADAWCSIAPTTSLDELVEIGDSLTTGFRDGSTLVPWCSLDDLAEAVRIRKDAHGMKRATEALGMICQGTESPPETQLRLLLWRAGHVALRPKVLARDRAGNPVLCEGHPIHPDLADERLRIAYEYEGDRHRVDPVQWARDIARVRALQAAGWIVIRVTKADLRDPRGLLADAHAAVTSRSNELETGSPRPSGQLLLDSASISTEIDPFRGKIRQKVTTGSEGSG